MLRVAVIIGSAHLGRVREANEVSVHAMLDQLVAWGGALKTMREKK